MADGFTVDVDALKDAGLGLADLLAELKELKVEDIDCDRVFVGHGGLADAYGSFCSRWQVGVENLTKDGDGLAKRLINAAGMYIEADQAAVGDLGGLGGG
ncbi:hypothetical protein GCM10022222_51280 [Amycolatopsis ultiminotia]|uniref:Excreted virulence factor EspC, type VII ESX diderm n=1 Tax=Amycolatopsis ultiminotia TaxID=543629 RepID=A0ABP6X8G6_9PSEU